MRIGVSATARETLGVRAQSEPRRFVRPGEGRADARRQRETASLHLRPGRVVLYAWLLAGIPIAALQAAHSGLHERNELSPLFHWLRDTSLAVPVAALAVTVAAIVVLRIRPASAVGRASLGSAAALGLLAAATFAVLAIPLAQVHGALFGAEAETGMTPLQHAVTEGIAVFQVALVLVPVVLVAGVPWRPAAGPALEGAHR